MSEAPDDDVASRIRRMLVRLDGLPDRDRDSIRVIGAGLAGLTAAAFVARAGLPVVVHESRDRLGGRATTDERDGFRFDQGPHALYRGGAAERVLAELGIQPRGTPRRAVAGAEVTPDADTRSTEVFEAERARLAGLAYRMLGTPDDADDVVQDAWLRWAAADRSARHRREVYVGPWLPEPLLAGDDDPLASIATAESLSLAFLTVLERLEPVERAVFLLHDVFGYPFADVAAHVERSEAAARQIAKRARDRVQAERPRMDADPTHAEELAEAFLGAVVQGDVVHLSDGGAHRRAARHPVIGADRVARLLVNLASRMEPGTRVDPVRVNGQLGWYVTVEGRPELVLVPSFRDGRVASVLAVLNPDKLGMRPVSPGWSCSPRPRRGRTSRTPPRCRPSPRTG